MRIWIVLAITLSAVTLVTCGGSDEEEAECTTAFECPPNNLCIDGECRENTGDNGDGDVADGDVADGDTIDGDVADGDTVDGDTTDGDTSDGDSTDGDVILPQSCEPPCKYMDGEYCDENSNSCKTIACTQCYEDSECEGGRRCINIKFQNPAQSEHMICAKTGCEDDSGCDPGYFCEEYVCRPMAMCDIDTSNPSLDQPCPYLDTNTDGVTCREDTQCVGLPPNPQMTCSTDADCTPQSPYPNGDCVNGQCGFSACMQRCNEQDACDGNHSPMDSGGFCVCIPNSDGQDFGLPCAQGGVHTDKGPCKVGLTCIGTQENPQATCSTPADCTESIQAPWNNGVADCAAGLCRFTVCAYACVNDACPDGGTPNGQGAQCVCLP